MEYFGDYGDSSYHRHANDPHHFGDIQLNETLRYIITVQYATELVRKFETIHISEANEFFRTQINMHSKAQTYRVHIQYINDEGQLLGNFVLTERLDTK